MRLHALTCFLLGVNISVYATPDSISVYFPVGSYVVTGCAKAVIDSALYSDVFIHGQKLNVIGYADQTGGGPANDTLSVKRADNVAQYLLRMGIRKEDLTVVAGKGAIVRKVNNTGDYSTDRRVDITTKNYEPVTVIDLTKVEKNGVVRLENILFQGGCALFLPESMPTLEMLAKLMNANAKLKIQIEGHVCCPEAPTSSYMTEARRNLAISQWEDEGWATSRARAHAVYSYLVRHGIDSTRLAHKGFGRTRMLVKPERNGDDMKKNRRVEIRILEK